MVIASILAGGLNSIAGGGSFLTFPALVLVGVPPVAANATSAVAVFPGYLSGVLGFRHELRKIERSVLVKYCLIGLFGGFGGALLLLFTPNTLFSFLVPWLLFFATLLFACGDKIIKYAKITGNLTGSTSLMLLFSVALYGGYFNGGLGIILLAALLFIGFTDLNLMNGLKNGISFSVSLVSVATFAVAGIVHWQEAGVMMVGATTGGYYGARLARKIPQKIMKAVIILIGVVMSCIFFYRLI